MASKASENKELTQIQPALLSMKSMPSPDILLESSFRRNWHSEKKHIHPGVVKSLAEVAAGRENDPLLSRGHSGQSAGCALALLAVSPAGVQRLSRRTVTPNDSSRHC
jgi:hypothetical protein